MRQAVALLCFGLLFFNDFHLVLVLVILVEIVGGALLAAPWASPATPLQARRYAHTPRRRHSVLGFFLYPWREAASRLPGVSPGVICRSGFLAPATFALVFAPVASFSQRLTPLSQPPNWDQLNRFQETITHGEFVSLLDSVYAPNGAAAQWIRVDSAEPVVQEYAPHPFVSSFAPNLQ